MNDTPESNPNLPVQSYGGAHEEALDPKIQRTRTPSASKWCPKCNCYERHRKGCEDDTIESANARATTAHEKEKWARERASFWLTECRKMHGKLAMLKAELAKLRKKLKP